MSETLNNPSEINPSENNTEWDTVGQEVPFAPDKVKIQVSEDTGKAIKHDYAVEVLRRSVREAKDEQKFSEVEKLADAIKDESNGFSKEEIAEVEEIQNSDIYKEEELRANINRKKEEIAQKEKELEDNIAEYASLMADGVMGRFKNRAKINQLRQSIDDSRQQIPLMKNQIEGMKTDLIQLLNVRQENYVAAPEAPTNVVPAEAPATINIPVVEAATDEAPIAEAEEPVIEEAAPAEVDETTEEVVEAPVAEVIQPAPETAEVEKPEWGDKMEISFSRSAKFADDLRKDPDVVVYPSNQENWKAVKKDDAISVLEDKIYYGDIDDDQEMFETTHLIGQILKKDSGFSEKDQADVKELMQTPEYKKKKLASELSRTMKFLDMRQKDLALCAERCNEMKEKYGDVISQFMNRFEINTVRERFEWTKRDVEAAQRDLERYKKELAEIQAMEAPSQMAA